MAANQMNNLTTLIKRLEAATSRLEDIASSSISLDQAPSSNTALVPPAPTAGSNASTQAPPAAPQSKAADAPASLTAFDKLIDEELKPWIKASEKLDPVLSQQASAVLDAFLAQRQFLLVSTKAKMPDMASPIYMELLKDLQQAMEKVDSTRQANRASPLKDHLAMVADGVGALGWVTVETSPKPADYVAELFGGAQMYGNKVLKEYKEKDRTHVEWVQSFYKLFKSLAAYIKQYHMNGVSWNSDGIDPAEALRQVKANSGSVKAPPAPPAPAGGAPPPPPPPPPPPMPVLETPGDRPKTAGPGDMNAVFEQLNRGEAVTAGLRKVDASQMTHKNPSLRTTGPVPDRGDSPVSRSKSPAPPGKKPKPESMRTKKPPKKELDGNKWLIENYDSPTAPVEIDASLTHSILISRCKNTTIRINGKANAIALDNSSRTSLILDSLVSSVDVIKCPNFALQVLGTLPTILLDQVDGATIYLSKESVNTEIFTSKCTSVNINLAPETDDGDYRECPVPEQIRSYVKDGQLVSEIVEHAG